jgi:hypothetical protein
MIASCALRAGVRLADRIDPEVVVEPVVLHGDDRVLHVGRDLVERDVPPLLVHAEPGTPVGRVEPRVAHAAPQLVDRTPLPHRPDDDERGDPDEAEIE